VEILLQVNVITGVWRPIDICHESLYRSSN